ncbi:hypothetical protein [Bartonella pachyuromydis]|uniref:Uncharacterized protein n=1 Tax=Bartonella pachyuromydis TaxID=931097 RepID=A0ABP8VA05_9HYPH
MNAHGLEVGVTSGSVGALQGWITGGQVGAFTGEVGSFALGYAGGAV